MKVAGFFTGHASWEKPFIEAGHSVFMSDSNEDYHWCDVTDDFLNLTAEKVIEILGGRPDVIVLSPPCTTFSIASCSTHWFPPTPQGARIPKSRAAVIGLNLLKHALRLIEDLRPKFWIMENPRGLMRKMNVLNGVNRGTVWYCQYGPTMGILRAKPTDLWGNWPDSFVLRAQCRNGSPNCDHERAPRGAKTGTQGLKDNAARSLIPTELCREWFDACSRDVGE